MSKEAIIFAIDAGNAMEEKFYDSGKSRLQVALECLKMTLEQKLFNNPGHEVGLNLFGEDDPDVDDNTTVLRPLSKPDLNLMRQLERLRETELRNSKKGGDSLQALEVALEQIDRHCGTKKYSKRIFLFTNGEGYYEESKKEKASRVSRVIELAREKNIRVNLLPIDFMETYDYETHQVDTEVMLSAAQNVNAEVFLELKRKCSELFEIFPASLSIEMYKKLRKKDTNPVAQFRGKLSMLGGLSIDVKTYKAIKKERLQPMGKYDRTAQFDPKLPEKGEKEIDTNVEYVREEDSEGSRVEPENIINAYQYGQNLVPFDKVVDEASKIREEKNFTMLGFVNHEQIPRHCFLGEVDIVVPETQPQTNSKGRKLQEEQRRIQTGRRLFSSFILSTIEQKKYMLARYVPRNSKNGVNPRLVVLIPFRSRAREMFYLVELPTIEGVREYPFNSLTQSTLNQKALVSELVKRMMLCNAETGEEEVKIENMFNPTKQYFFQTVLHRVYGDHRRHDSNKLINEMEEESMDGKSLSQGGLPKMSQVIKDYITPEERVYQRTAGVIEKIQKAFKLKEREIKKPKQCIVTWNDIMESQKSKDSLDIDNSTCADTEEERLLQNEAFEGLKRFNLDTDNGQAFNEHEPIVSFKKMVRTHQKQALTSMAEYIVNGYLEISKVMGISPKETENKTEGLLICSKQLRDFCLTSKKTQPQNYAPFWDSWLEKIKDDSSCPGLFKALRFKGCGFIESNNEDIFKPDNLSNLRPVERQIEDELD